MKGSGPGVIAPDGSPVEFYRRLDPGPTVGVVAAQLAPEAAVLDLGCGVGRIADALVEGGYRVVGVDEEPAMLACVRRAETVHADIIGLDLRPRQFDAVLLLSNLVNHPAPEIRQGLLRTCRRHVTPNGLVLLAHLDADWAATARDGVAFDDDDIRISLRDVRRADRRLAGTTVYEADGKTWTQSWDNEILDDDDLDAALDQADLRRALRLTATLLAARRTT